MDRSQTALSSWRHSAAAHNFSKHPLTKLTGQRGFLKISGMFIGSMRWFRKSGLWHWAGQRQQTYKFRDWPSCTWPRLHRYCGGSEGQMQEHKPGMKEWTQRWTLGFFPFISPAYHAALRCVFQVKCWDQSHTPNSITTYWQMDLDYPLLKQWGHTHSSFPCRFPFQSMCWQFPLSCGPSYCTSRAGVQGSDLNQTPDLWRALPQL